MVLAQKESPHYDSQEHTPIFPAPKTFEPKRRSPPAAEHPLANPKGRRILLVDDNPETLLKFSKELRDKGATVDTAPNAKDAKERLITRPGYDILLTDLDLSGKTLQLEGKLGGLRLIQWCARNGLPAEMILHSTAFDKPVMALLHKPVKILAELAGATVQGKRMTHDILNGKTDISQQTASATLAADNI